MIARGGSEFVAKRSRTPTLFDKRTERSLVCASQ
jgi:hypothetical protein